MITLLAQLGVSAALALLTASSLPQKREPVPSKEPIPQPKPRSKRVRDTISALRGEYGETVQTIAPGQDRGQQARDRATGTNRALQDAAAKFGTAERSREDVVSRARSNPNDAARRQTSADAATYTAEGRPQATFNPDVRVDVPGVDQVTTARSDLAGRAAATRREAEEAARREAAARSGVPLENVPLVGSALRTGRSEYERRRNEGGSRLGSALGTAASLGGAGVPGLDDAVGAAYQQIADDPGRVLDDPGGVATDIARNTGRSLKNKGRRVTDTVSSLFRG